MIILYCLVFREQSPSLSSDLIIISWCFLIVKNFLFFLNKPANLYNNTLPIKAGIIHFLPYLSATCIMIHVFLVFVNTKFDFLFFYTKGVLIKSTRLYIHMVATQRFELRTLRVWTACSSQLSYAAVYMELITRFELVTSSLPRMRSTNWAIAA